MIWLCFLPVEGTYALSVLPGLVVMAVGYGLTFSPIYAAATGGPPLHLTGTASGLVTTSQQMGGAVGLAVLSGVAASVTGSLSSQHATRALTTGYNAGMAAAAAFTFVAVLLAAFVVKTANSSR